MVLRKNCEDFSAEVSILCFTSSIIHLTQRDFYKNSCEQLKLENSKKWRLQERDDWKALVDSVQRDRTRLQQENLALEAELAESKHLIEDLQEQLAQLRNGAPDASSATDTPNLIMNSPPTTPRAPMTPTATSRSLRLELDRAREQVGIL